MKIITLSEILEAATRRELTRARPPECGHCSLLDMRCVYQFLPSVEQLLTNYTGYYVDLCNESFSALSFIISASYISNLLAP